VPLALHLPGSVDARSVRPREASGTLLQPQSSAINHSAAAVETGRLTRFFCVEEAIGSGAWHWRPML
jgi:hypothetical protein